MDFISRFLISVLSDVLRSRSELRERRKLIEADFKRGARSTSHRMRLNDPKSAIYNPKQYRSPR